MIKPLWRYPGGKSWLAGPLSNEILACRPTRYIEPFLGAGAVALVLPAGLPKVLSDLSRPLMNVWESIKTQPAALHAALLRLHATHGNTSEGFYEIRDRYNASGHFGANAAAMMLYLNSISFNGLHRENASGQYNVPFGDVKKPRVLSLEELLLAQTHLRSAQLYCCGYQEVLTEAGQGSAAFIDPPYWGGFDDYVAGGFSEDDQRELASQVQAAVGRGAKIWLTNSDTPLIREIYGWADIQPIAENRSIAADGDRRGGAGCVLVRG